MIAITEYELSQNSNLSLLSAVNSQLLLQLSDAAEQNPDL